MDHDVLFRALEFVLAAGIVTLIPTGIVSARLWQLIKRRHPRVWSDIGEPRIEPMGIAKSRRLRGFIRSRAYERLADVEVDSYARSLRVLNCILTIMFWIGIGLVLLVAITAGADLW